MPGLLRVERGETVSLFSPNGHSLSVAIGYCIRFRTWAGWGVGVDERCELPFLMADRVHTAFPVEETAFLGRPSPAPGSVALQGPDAVNNLSSCA